ncbi:MAG: DUF1269 domain-containing protein [Xenococcaceae cyanobacterium MO_234.B1]|nr:DUF1269 domain-containing protein [Xenococcaceae cyanobacterium MO_234.B1]
MEKVIVVVFDDEAKAHQGSNQLKQLHQSTDLTLYAVAVIAKDASGKVEVLQTADEGPIGTLIGTALGSMVGLLGGPAGVAVGLSGGALAGALSDISRMGIDLEFLNDVGAVMTPEKVAVVASVDEEWTTPLDSAIKPLGGILFRKPGNEVIDDLIEREIQKTGIELKALQAEFNSATTEQQAQLQAKIDTTHQTLQAQIDAADKWVVETSERVDTKIKAMQEQVTKASENKQAEMEQHIRKIKTDIGVCQLINDG